ncbi:MAG: ComF family protein [Lachnospiraceae bacterium]|nr:ComF family protein [Lachnospiraceae bacterium]
MQQIITELLFPRRCPVCDDIAVPWGTMCCPVCQGKIRYLGSNYCMRCGKGLSDQETEYCHDCRKYPHKFVRGRSLYRYESVAGSLFRFKYKGRQEYADFFGEELYRYLGRDIRAMQIEAVVPVPLHKSRLKERGYNQAALLGKALAKRCELAFREDIVIRHRKTVPQKQLSRKERQNNLKRAFKLTENDVKLNTLLIVDDIYTTGSTVDALAEVLLGGGVRQIYVVTLAAGME